MIITFIRKHLMNAYTSIPVLVCLFFVTLNSYGKRPISTVKFSGEEMFRGVFFAEGQFAELIPELKATQTLYSSTQLSVDEKKALALVRTQIIASIKASDSHYFEDFEAGIQTANPVLIKEKLKEGQEMVTKITIKLSNLKESDLKSLDRFLAEGGKNVNKKTLAHFMKKCQKITSSNQANGTGTCVMIPCVLYFIVVFELTVIPNQKSKLMLEQMVCSICTIASTVG